MGQMIVYQKELIRINASKNCIEFSTNDGRSWHHRVNASSTMGALQDLADNSKEILLTTTKELFFSTNKDCYLEIFDEETNQWEYVAESREPEVINNWYNNLEPFFCKFNLSFLFKTIENAGQTLLLDKNKGLPLDCSDAMRRCYDFYFYEVKICYSASYFQLAKILDFDYNRTIDLKEISKKDLKLWYPQIYESKQKEISFNKWLGLDYFEELQLIRDRFHKYPKCRIIYFVYDIDID